MIRLALADDHAMVRTGLVQLLDRIDDFAVVGTAANGHEAVAVVRETRPDVMLMDLSMPELDGIEAIRRVRRHEPDVRVIVLTTFSDRRRIVEAVDAGAVGYLLKDAEPDEIVRAVRAAARDESPLDPRIARALLDVRRETVTDCTLTRREREVLVCIAAGTPNKLIARQLGIAEKTVKCHLTNIFGRIGVTDRTQAALWAHEHGIVHESS